MTGSTDIFDILQGTRAMRRLKPDPVADELIDKILAAAAAAPNGGNRQTWRFIVVRDPEIKSKVQKYYKRAFDEVVSAHYAAGTPLAADQIQTNLHANARSELSAFLPNRASWNSQACRCRVEKACGR